MDTQGTQTQFLAEGTPVRAPTGEEVILKEQRPGNQWLADDGATYAADQLKPLNFGAGIAGAPPGDSAADRIGSS